MGGEVEVVVRICVMLRKEWVFSERCVPKGGLPSSSFGGVLVAGLG